eukprot:SM000085S23214  [mRNA]  locus=s85:174139:175311:+ [translate_table: standard]
MTPMQSSQYLLALLEGVDDGRFLRLDPQGAEAEVLLQGLQFPNGVALSKDESFVVIAETATDRLLRYWLKGPKAKTVDTFARLPGPPDNVRRNDVGEFWVALHSRRKPFYRFLSSNPWARKLLVSLPIDLDVISRAVVGKPPGLAMKLDEDGRVVEVLEDRKGEVASALSEAMEHGGRLWLGSVLQPSLLVYNLTTMVATS